MSRPFFGPLTTILPFLILFAFCVPGIAAFGAGNIPSFAFLEGKAFRHGDIEDTLEELLKKGSGAAGGFALGSLLSKGSKFGGLDIKRVYFGNWLRDYSQAVDVAGLKKLPIQTIMNLCMVLGFMAHGYATAEFEVTQERLGVYLPTEHIDNPKGYPDDARKYDPRLRGPVGTELEIDPRTGMKNYIANENGSWDTSRALVRRTLERCIHYGRLYRTHERKEDQYEAFRLLGQALHTLEDFPAHSNFCELALVSLGHHQVFVHVGDQVRIHTPHGRSVAPLVTGTFGGSDFVHSLLGEATDHISQASVSDLNKELDSACSKSASGSSTVLRQLFGSIPGGGGNDLSRSMETIDQIRAGPAAGGKRPEEMSPQELHNVLWQVLSFRDSVMKRIENTIEKIPGLGTLIDKISDSVSVFIYTTIEPYLKPLLQNASTTLATGSAEVINNEDQFEVFHNPRASDPTHSFLSKDHFNLILNEPAGNLAKLILAHTVKLVVKAWDDPSVNVRDVTEDALSCLFHPDFHNSSSQIQREMMQYMHTWLNSHGHQKEAILSRLTRDAVRNHRNIRASGDNVGAGNYVGGAGHEAGINAQNKISGYLNQIPVVQQATSIMNTIGVGGSENTRRDTFSTSSLTSERFSPPSLPPPGTGTTYVPPFTGTGEAASYYSSGKITTSQSSAASGGQQEYHYQHQERFAASSGPPPGTGGTSPSYHENSIQGSGSHHGTHYQHRERYSAPSGPPSGAGGTFSSYSTSEKITTEGSPMVGQEGRHYQHSTAGSGRVPYQASDKIGFNDSAAPSVMAGIQHGRAQQQSYSSPTSGARQEQHASTTQSSTGLAFPSPHVNPGPGPGPGYAPHYLPPPGAPPAFNSPPSFPTPDGPPPSFVPNHSGIPSFAPPPGPPPNNVYGPPGYPPPGGFTRNSGGGYGGGGDWR